MAYSYEIEWSSFSRLVLTQGSQAPDGSALNRVARRFIERRAAHADRLILARDRSSCMGYTDDRPSCQIGDMDEPSEEFFIDQKPLIKNYFTATKPSRI